MFNLGKWHCSSHRRFPNTQCLVTALSNAVSHFITIPGNTFTLRVYSIIWNRTQKYIRGLKWGSKFSLNILKTSGGAAKYIYSMTLLWNSVTYWTINRSNSRSPPQSYKKVVPSPFLSDVPPHFCQVTPNVFQINFKQDVFVFFTLSTILKLGPVG